MGRLEPREALKPNAGYAVRTGVARAEGKRVMPDRLLAGFERFEVDVDGDGVQIAGRSTGSEPPVLLPHGYPQAHVMWHQVAPVLAERHTVVLAELRGYGESAKPAA